jgi:hypothetical protein
MPVEDISQLIPIFGIFMVVALVIGPMWIRSYFNARERAQLHETMRTAYEKGQPVPPELIERLTAPPAPRSRLDAYDAQSDLRRGLVLIGVGLGVVCLGAGLWYGMSGPSEVGGNIVGGIVAGAGAIPGFIGVAYLILWLARRAGGRD